MVANPIHNVFSAECIAERDLEDVTFYLFENRIFYAVIKKNQMVTMDVVNAGYDFLNDHGGGTFYNIFQFESFAEINPEVRTWAANESGNHYTIIDAIVISSFAQKILADFYIKFNRPVKPTRIFTNLKSAVAWVNECIEGKKAS